VTVVAAALLTGPSTLTGPASEPSRSPWPVRSRRRFAGGVVVLLVAWVSICGSALLLLSAHSLDSSRDAAADGEVQAAVDAANDAIDLQPWAAEPRTQLALVYEQAGDYGEAREAIDEAIERSPEDYRLHLLASRMASEDDDPEAARQALVAAHLLNPRDPEIFDQASAS
jgi:tetratricopeptide (TPR) repeat protein